MDVIVQMMSDEENINTSEGEFFLGNKTTVTSTWVIRWVVMWGVETRAAVYSKKKMFRCGYVPTPWAGNYMLQLS